MYPTCFEPRGFILRETGCICSLVCLHESVWPFWWVGNTLSYPPDCSQRCL